MIVRIIIMITIMKIQVTHSRHYESFRCSKLQEMMHSVGGKVRIVIIVIMMTMMLLMMMMMLMMLND